MRFDEISVPTVFVCNLATLAIPIIIHLFNFQGNLKPYTLVIYDFKEVKQQTKAQSELKHLLILLSRLLAITSLVLAFAQPYVTEKIKL